MTNFHEDVPGAEQASDELRARHYAATLEIAVRTSAWADQTRIIQSYMRAGLTREVRAARRELIRVYQLDDPDREPDALTTLREMVTLTLNDSRPDDPGIEDYTRSDGIPL